jgi:hypothetical protein
VGAGVSSLCLLILGASSYEETDELSSAMLMQLVVVLVDP